MNTQHLREQGYSVTWVILFLLVLGVIGFAGWKVMNKEDGKTDSNSTSTDSEESASFVRWDFDGSAWKAMSTAPDCEDPLTIAAPMDLSQATSKLYPGQVRGGDFKPHGGIGIDDATNTSMSLYALRDAYLYQGSRYIEGGVQQILLDFMDSCGVRYRYDHIAKVSDELQQYVDQLPEAKQDDSRTSPIDPVLIKKGAIVATEVGRSGNVFFDLGVYDLRKQNKASKTDIYKTDQGRISDKEQSFFAVCWFDLLSTSDKAIIDGLPSRSAAEGANSDYCEVR